MVDFDIEEELRYPTESDDWVTTVLIGGGLLLFSFLIVPALLMYGYIASVIRGSLEGANEPPVFEDWGDLLVDGVKGFAIFLVYMFIPIVVFGLTFVVSFISFLTGTDAGFAAGFGGMILGLFVSSILGIIFGYFGAVGFVNFVYKDSIGAAFDIGTIKTVALSKAYAVPFLIGAGTVFVASLVANFVPLIGSLIALFTTFYAYIVAANLMTKGFKDALGIETVDESSSEQPSVDDPGVADF